MASERQRLVELALESLQRQKKEIDAEIEQFRRLLKHPRAAAVARKAPAGGGKRPRYTKSEREQRSRQMKATWENRRKQDKGEK
jgi:hypothetical protein